MTIHVHDLAPAPGSTKQRKRVARGTAGKGGKTAGRGTKGQRARGTVPRGFEGGQMPLKQRVPKLRGFTNPFRVEYAAVNLDTLQEQADRLGTTTLTPETLAAAGVVRAGAYVKILARGEVTAKLDVSAHGVSKAATAAITAAGGSVTLIPLPFKGENKAGRPAVRGNQFTNR
jgi:large subunit ribosomal protein L15